MHIQAKLAAFSGKCIEFPSCRAVFQRLCRYLVAVACSLAVILLTPSASLSQRDPEYTLPALRQIDESGVDILSGQYVSNIPLVGGAGDVRLSLSLEIAQPAGSIYAYSLSANTLAGGIGHYLSRSLRPIADTRTPFANTGGLTNINFPSSSGYLAGSLTRTNPDGSSYRQSSGPTHVTYFNSVNSIPSGYYDNSGGRMYDASPYSSREGMLYQKFSSFKFPDGEIWTFHRQYTGPLGDANDRMDRVRFITSSKGYGIQILYVSDTAPTSKDGPWEWLAPTRVTFYNKAVHYCNESVLIECSNVTNLSTSKAFYYDNINGTVTIKESGSSEGLELKFRNLGGGWDPRLLSIRHTDVQGSLTNLQYSNIVHQGSGGTVYWYTYEVANSLSTSRYSIVSSDSEFETSISQARFEVDTEHVGTSSHYRTGGNLLNGRWDYFSDPLGRVTQVGFSDNINEYDRNEIISWPGLGKTRILRDNRANVTSVARYEKASDVNYIMDTFSYPGDCSNPVVCNRPSTTVISGVTTTYSYAPEHGGMLTEVGTTVNGAAPAKRFYYLQRSAWIKNSGGGYSQVPNPMWMLVEMRSCRTTNLDTNNGTCAGGASDLVTTRYEYGTDIGPNNLLQRGKVVTADGVSLRTCYGYDASGNKISETSPRAGLTGCP